MRVGRPTNRSALAAVYVLATLLAQCAHNHGRPSADADSAASCAARGAQFTGQRAGQGLDTLDNCPACQYRTSSHAWHSLNPFVVLGAVDASTHPEPASLVSRSPLRLACRAPPRV